MSNWAKECKELKTGLIGLAVTKALSKKTRQRITKGGDAALKCVVDPLGETKKFIDTPSNKKNGQPFHVHVHHKK